MLPYFLLCMIYLFLFIYLCFLSLSCYNNSDVAIVATWNSIQASRVSVSFIRCSTSFDRKWAPSLKAAISLSPLRDCCYYLVLKFQHSRKRRQDEEGKESDTAAINDLVLTFCPTMCSIHLRKLRLLMPALFYL